MARIEILNRELYLKRARKRLEDINAIRANKDAAYERRWRKMPWPFKDLPASRTPPHDWDYPSIYGWYQRDLLTRVITALSSENTGTVYLDSDEFSLVAND